MPLSTFEADATWIQLDVPGSRLGQPGPCNKISKWWYPVSAYFPAARFTSGHIFLLPILLRPDCWCTLSLLWHWAGCCVEEFYKIWSTSSRRRTLGSLDFPLDLMIGGINTSRKRCQGKRTTFAKLRYCWSNSFSYYNNLLFSIEISSALFKRLVKSDQWIRCLKPDVAIFWERQSPCTCRLITSTRISSWVFIRQCQHIVPYIIFFNFFSKTFLTPTNLATISKFPRWVENGLKTMFDKQPQSILPN